jgi:hypothetical protein
MTSEVLLLRDFLNAQECASIIASAEAYAANYGWTKDRHGPLFSTTDIPLSRFDLNETWLSLMSQRMAAVSQKHWGGRLRSHDAFVVKYQAGMEETGEQMQRFLTAHYDAGLVTFSVVLSRSSDYSGGGVRFKLMQRTYAERLRAFYMHYDKSKLYNIPTLLTKYNGTELLAALV